MTNRKATIAWALVTFLLGLVLGGAAAAWIETRGHRASSVALNLQAGRAFESGQFDRAIGLAYQAVALDPSDYSPYNLLGRIYEQTGKKQLALEAYGSALERTYTPPNAHERPASVAEFDRKQISEAVQRLRR